MPRHLTRDTHSSLARALRRAGRRIRHYVSGEHLMAALVSALHPGPGPKAGRPIPVARLHDLRHVHATTLLRAGLRAGVPVHVVAARLGHADPSTTLRVYAHVISEQLAEAADIFASAVGAD
jgi:integrase